MYSNFVVVTFSTDDRKKSKLAGFNLGDDKELVGESANLVHYEKQYQ